MIFPFKTITQPLLYHYFFRLNLNHLGKTYLFSHQKNAADTLQFIEKRPQAGQFPHGFPHGFPSGHWYVDRISRTISLISISAGSKGRFDWISLMRKSQRSCGAGRRLIYVADLFAAFFIGFIQYHQQDWYNLVYIIIYVYIYTHTVHIKSYQISVCIYIYVLIYTQPLLSSPTLAPTNELCPKGLVRAGIAYADAYQAYAHQGFALHEVLLSPVAELPKIQEGSQP